MHPGTLPATTPAALGSQVRLLTLLVLISLWRVF